MSNNIDEMAEIPTNEEWRAMMVRARKAKDWSQEYLGGRVGTSQNIISLIEKGPPDGVGSSTFIQRICHALEIPLPLFDKDEDDRAWVQLGRRLRSQNLETFRATLRLVESIVPETVAGEHAAPAGGAQDAPPTKK